MRFTRRSLLAGLPALGAQQRPVFSFGVVADIQYADKETAGPRRYRESLRKVEEWKTALKSEQLEFIIHLGDLIDEGVGNISPALHAFQGLHPRTRLVLGNHDYTVARSTLMPRLGLKRAYYDFSVRGFRFVVIDGMDIAAKGG